MSRFDRAHAPASHAKLLRIALKVIRLPLTSTLADAAAPSPDARC